MKRVFLTLILILLSNLSLTGKAIKNNQILRETAGTFDLQQNTVGNINSYFTNYGIWGLNVSTSKGGFTWQVITHQYVFGAGFWLGVKKNVDGELSKLVSISYNSNNGLGWYVPGRIEDGDAVDKDLVKKYRLYFSTDFDDEGGPLEKSDGPNWPLWIEDNESSFPMGILKHLFVFNTFERNLYNYPLGPLYFADEHLFSTYKDTDITHYQNAVKRHSEGYPIGIQVEENIFFWNDGTFKDAMIIVYELQNKSGEELLNCWFSPLIDTDIAQNIYGNSGAMNDFINYYEDETANINFGYAWTNGEWGEAGEGFGYIGVSLLESPAVDENSDLRKDKNYYEYREQLGIVTFANPSIEDDTDENVKRYDMISNGEIDVETSPKDRRMVISTGPFNWKPDEKIRIALGITLANTAMGADATGSLEDIANLIKIQKDLKDFYYSNINTSVKRNNYIPESKLYPNPADNYITLESNYELSSDTKVILINYLGEELSILSKSSNNSQNNYSYELPRISPGVYFIKIETPKGTCINKFIKR